MYFHSITKTKLEMLNELYTSTIRARPASSTGTGSAHAGAARSRAIEVSDTDGTTCARATRAPTQANACVADNGSCTTTGAKVGGHGVIEKERKNKPLFSITWWIILNNSTKIHEFWEHTLNVEVLLEIYGCGPWLWSLGCSRFHKI